MASQPVKEILLLGLLSSLVMLGGCQSTTLQTPVPALLSNTNAQTTATLNTAASKLLGGNPVTLGSSAFVANSALTLETAMRNTPLGRLGSGRIVEQPDALLLLRKGRHCLLEHVNTGKQITLKLTNCIATPRSSSRPAEG